MNSWTPLFNKIVDSSVWCEPDHVRIVFVTMLAIKDSDHVVRYSAFQLGQRAKKTEAEVLDALRILSSPDTRRKEKQPFDGRRIEKVEGGWLVLNGQFYEDFMRKMNRRSYKTKWQRDRRLRDSVPRGTSEYNQPAPPTSEQNGEPTPEDLRNGLEEQ